MTCSGQGAARRPAMARAAAVIPSLLLPLLLLARAAQAVPVPPLEAHVNDRAGLLSPAARSQLEQELTDYEGKSGHQLVLLTVPSLDGEALEAYSMRVVESWKLGRKGVDDGLLMLVVKEPHGIRIEVGYGLEGAIPDALAARIIRDVMAPAFRNDGFASGIESAFGLLITAASGGAVALADPPRQDTDRASANDSDGPPLWLVLLLIPVFPLVPVFILLLLRLLMGPPDPTQQHTVSVVSSGRSDFSSGGSSGSDSGGYSGGGGSFGGGGASGSW